MYTRDIGAVFRRNHTGQTTFSSNEVNSDDLSWQGYEAIKGRINSQNLGILNNNFYSQILCIHAVWYFRFHCIITTVQQLQRKS